MPENQEILRLVESIHREKEVSRETVFVALESALTSACKKRPGGSSDNEVVVHIDRETGEIIAMDGDARIPMAELGRIAAQTAKQVLIQRIREAERDIIFAEYEQKVGDMVTGNVQRYDKGGLIVNLGKVEGILPRQEQIFNENYSPGERIRAIITEVRKRGNKVIIALSRTSTKLVTGLFELEVPEIGDRIIEIKDIVREPGVRTKIAVHSVDSKVDCVGACVGVRGNRIRNIVNELNGERIDIIVWSPIEENYIVNAMSPSEVIGVELDRDEGRARVIVREDQLSLAIGKKGQNVRLAAKLTNLHIDIITEAQLSEERTKFKEEMLQLPQMDDELYDRFLFNGIESVYDIVDSDIEELCEIRGVDEDLAQQLIASSEEVIAAGEMEQEEQQERSEEDGEETETENSEQEGDEPHAAQEGGEETEEDGDEGDEK